LLYLNKKYASAYMEGKPLDKYWMAKDIRTNWNIYFC
jgi:hypothetical protein